MLTKTNAGQSLAQVDPLEGRPPGHGPGVAPPQTLFCWDLVLGAFGLTSSPPVCIRYLIKQTALSLSRLQPRPWSPVPQDGGEDAGPTPDPPLGAPDLSLQT
ncbi:unnamed protein product [Arctogadus glacialis]